MIELVTRFEARDKDAADRFADQLAIVRQAVVAEPGFVSYAAYRTREQPTVLFVLERWRTQGDLHAETVMQAEEVSEALALLTAPLHRDITPVHPKITRATSMSEARSHGGAGEPGPERAASLATVRSMVAAAEMVISSDADPLGSASDVSLDGWDLT